jgi:hypothetical protein
LSLKSRKQLKKALFLQKYMTKKQSLVIKKVKKYALLTKWFKKPKYKLFFKKIVTRFKFLLNSKTTQIKSLVLKKNSLTYTKSSYYSHIRVNISQLSGKSRKRNNNVEKRKNTKFIYKKKIKVTID